MARESACAKLRKLMARPGIVVAPNIWDPFSARVAERLGIECVVLGGYAMGAGTVISEPLMTMTEVVGVSGRRGDYTVKLKLSPRYVNAKCTACGDCAAAVEKQIFQALRIRAVQR